MKKILLSVLSIIVLGVIAFLVYINISVDIPEFNRVKMTQFIDNYWIQDESDVQELDELIHSIKWKKGNNDVEVHDHSVVIRFYQDGEQLDSKMTVTENEDCEFLLEINGKEYYCKEDSDEMQKFIDEYMSSHTSTDN